MTKPPNVTSYYSAIEIGLHRFCRKKIAKMFVGSFKFVMIRRRTGYALKVLPVISYGH